MQIDALTMREDKADRFERVSGKCLQAFFVTKCWGESSPNPSPFVADFTVPSEHIKGIEEG